MDFAILYRNLSRKAHTAPGSVPKKIDHPGSERAEGAIDATPAPKAAKGPTADFD